jgi:uncharacterized tellurite resistance protein B-like protein
MCPSCETTEQFRLKSSRPFLTLYFVPVMPIGGLNEYVQCTRCRNAFETMVLSNRMLPTDSLSSPAKMEEISFEQDLLNVIALMMIEDGQITENEIQIARRLYGNIAQQNISRDELGRACSQVRLQRWNTLRYLQLANARRKHDEKLLLVQAMFGVAGADGEITPGRLRTLAEMMETLELDEHEFQRAIESTNQWLA